MSYYLQEDGVSKFVLEDGSGDYLLEGAGGVSITDTGATVTDSLSSLRTRSLTDTGLTVTDALASLRTRLVTETGLTVSDSTASTRVRLLTDTGATITDSVALRGHLTITDTGLTISDSIQKSAAKFVTDTGAAISETLATGRVRPVTDTGLTASDVLASLRNRIVTDTGLTVTDSLAKATSRTLADTGLSVTDSIARGFPRPVIDTGLTVTDALALLVARFLEDDGLVLDDFIGTNHIFITDEAFDGLDWDFGDSIDAVLLVFSTDTGCTITDSIAVTPNRRRLLVDTGLAVGDSIQKTTAKLVTDTGATVTDTLHRQHAVALTDTGATVADSTRMAVRRFVTDQGLTVSTGLVVSKNGHGASVNITDQGATIVSTLARTASYFRTVTPDTGVNLSDGLIATVNGGPPNACTTDFRRFLNDLDASPEFMAWCAANPLQCAIWGTYTTAILDGGSPSPPAMADTDGFGTALVDAGIVALDGIIPCRAKPPPKTGPQAAFTFIINGLTVSFTNTSTPGASGLIDSFLWTYGDGNTEDHIVNPIYTYAGANTYIVTLTVVGGSSDGISTISHPVTVFVPSTVGIHIDAVAV